MPRPRGFSRRVGIYIKFLSASVARWYVLAAIGNRSFRGTCALSPPYTPSESTMLTRLFPATLDNNYRGHKAALWLFAIIVLLRLIIGLNSMINTHHIAVTADGIPLDSYPPAAAQMAEHLFAILGLWNLLFALLGILVLARYRAMVPMFLLFLITQYVLGKVNNHFHPDGTSGSAPSGTYLMAGMFVIMLVGLALSVVQRSEGSRSQPA